MKIRPVGTMLFVKGDTKVRHDNGGISYFLHRVNKKSEHKHKHASTLHTCDATIFVY